MIYTIYGIYNNDNLIYVGSTSDFIKRKRTHICAIKYNNTNSKIKLYQYIKQNNLTINIQLISIHENISKDEIAILESEYIKINKPLLNQRQAIKLSTRYNLRDYQKKKYIYYKELKKLMKINLD
jgi:hypothetical protein